MKMNRLEIESLKKLYHQTPDGAASFLCFRRRAFYSHINGCWLIPWCGMIVGIESDGYTHS